MKDRPFSNIFGVGIPLTESGIREISDLMAALRDSREYAVSLKAAARAAREELMDAVSLLDCKMPESAGEAISRAIRGLSDSLEGAPTQCEPMPAIDDDGWTEWAGPQNPYFMQCCDCGLIHEAEFRVTKDKIRKPDGSWDAVWATDPNYEVVFRMRRHSERHQMDSSPKTCICKVGQCLNVELGVTNPYCRNENPACNESPLRDGHPDARRMDWLMRQPKNEDGSTLEWWVGGDKLTHINMPTLAKIYDGKTLREAIDAAIADENAVCHSKPHCAHHPNGCNCGPEGCNNEVHRGARA